MKIKFDYVTNSSSTSFTGYGIKLKWIPERLWHPMYEYFKKSEEYDGECFEKFILEGIITKTFDDFIDDHGLVVRYCCETEELFIGIYAKGWYDLTTQKYICEDICKDLDKIKEIFGLMFRETASIDFMEFCDKIEFIDKEWYH